MEHYCRHVVVCTDFYVELRKFGCEVCSHFQRRSGCSVPRDTGKNIHACPFLIVIHCHALLRKLSSWCYETIVVHDVFLITTDYRYTPALHSTGRLVEPRVSRVGPLTGQRHNFCTKAARLMTLFLSIDSCHCRSSPMYVAKNTTSSTRQCFYSYSFPVRMQFYFFLQHWLSRQREVSFRNTANTGSKQSIVGLAEKC